MGLWRNRAVAEMQNSSTQLRKLGTICAWYEEIARHAEEPQGTPVHNTNAEYRGQQEDCDRVVEHWSTKGLQYCQIVKGNH